VSFRPLHDHILAKRREPEAKTSGGLFIPDNAKEKPLEATVISVGTGKRLDNGTLVPLAVKAGDHILITKYAGSDIKLLGNDHMIIREDDVLAILDRDHA
jgi:chaperonin GroES